MNGHSYISLGLKCLHDDAPLVGWSVDQGKEMRIGLHRPIAFSAMHPRACTAGRPTNSPDTDYEVAKRSIAFFSVYFCFWFSAVDWADYQPAFGRNISHRIAYRLYPVSCAYAWLECIWWREVYRSRLVLLGCSPWHFTASARSLEPATLHLPTALVGNVKQSVLSVRLYSISWTKCPSLLYTGWSDVT